MSHVARQRTAEAYDNAAFVAKEIRESAREASQVDLSSTFVNTNDPKQVEAVLDEALQTDPGLNTLLQSIVGYSPTISDAAITDVNGRAIVHTDPSAIGTQLEPREDFQNVRNGSFRRQLEVVYGAPRVYDVYRHCHPAITRISSRGIEHCIAPVGGHWPSSGPDDRGRARHHTRA